MAGRRIREWANRNLFLQSIESFENIPGSNISSKLHQDVGLCNDPDSSYQKIEKVGRGIRNDKDDNDERDGISPKKSITALQGLAPTILESRTFDSI